MENLMKKKMENEMDAGLMCQDRFHSSEILGHFVSCIFKKF